MELRELILKNRSYRRFSQHEAIGEKTLKNWIDLARLSPSARNAQPLKYIISTSQETNAKIFPLLAWAGYLTDWDGPGEGERPAAYIIMLEDKKIASNLYCDHGIASQSILLGAVEDGFGGCIIASVKKQELRKALDIPEQFRIIQVIALGKPKETVVLDEIKDDGDIKYWRDDKQVHHVPKRSMEEIIVKEM